MATILEQSFVDICTKHGLSCLSVSYHSGAVHVGSEFTVYAHAEGRACGSASAHRLSDAAGRAIAELHSQPIALADEPLQLAAPARSDVGEG